MCNSFLFHLEWVYRFHDQYQLDHLQSSVHCPKAGWENSACSFSLSKVMVISLTILFLMLRSQVSSSFYLSTPDDRQKTTSSKYRSKTWGVVWTTLARLFCQHCDCLAQCSPVQPSTAQYSSGRPSTAENSPVQLRTVQYSPARYSTAQYSSLQHSCSPVHSVTACYPR